VAPQRYIENDRPGGSVLMMDDEGVHIYSAHLAVSMKLKARTAWPRGSRRCQEDHSKAQLSGK